MAGEFSTGSRELDGLLEELRAGDNVVFYTHRVEDYTLFVSALLGAVRSSPLGLVYVRSAGKLDELVASVPGTRVLDLASLPVGSSIAALREEILRIGPRVYYLFEPLESLSPWVGEEEEQRAFFLTICPLLFQMESIAYWALAKGRYKAATIAAIKDCTQVFLEVGRAGQEISIAPLKVWGRYSEAMFRPHRVTLAGGELHIHPLPLTDETQMAYNKALAEKNREVEIRERQLRSFLEEIIANQEQESRRLAFDLHDGLVQLIVAAYQHLQTAQAWRHRDPGLEEKETEQGVQLLRRAISEARRLIGKMRPAGLDDLGLVHALRLYIAQLAAEADWQIALEVDPAWMPLPAALEASLFRIIQEATTNARKYAEAKRVQISLRWGPQELGVLIQDWGKGFDPEEVLAVPQQGLHMGLVGIRERVLLWGGHCVIKSQPGEGTTIEVCIPRSRIPALSEERS